MMGQSSLAWVRQKHFVQKFFSLSYIIDTRASSPLSNSTMVSYMRGCRPLILTLILAEVKVSSASSKAPSASPVSFVIALSQ